MRPEFTLPELDGVEVTVDDLAVGDEQVNEQLDTLRERFGSLTVVDRPAAEGDFLSIDLAPPSTAKRSTASRESPTASAPARCCPAWTTSCPA